MEQDEFALELYNVSAGYDGVKILKGITFRLKKGRRLAVLGPNGSGKTTLLRVLAGLLPYEGKAVLEAGEISGMRHRELAGRVAMMSQLTGRVPAYTVYDTVMMGRYLHIPQGFLARPSRGDRAAVGRCLTAAGLGGMERHYITELSGGQLQRVFLARTLAQEPSVILLDEPTSHLDLKYQTELVDYLSGWAGERNRTVVGVLHDLPLAMRMADTFLLLKDGEIAAYGTAEEVLDMGSLKKVYGMDVAGYLAQTLGRLEKITHGEKCRDGGKRQDGENH